MGQARLPQPGEQLYTFKASHAADQLPNSRRIVLSPVSLVLTVMLPSMHTR